MHVNNRVLILREAITKIVPMLTQRKVKVTQQGSQAYVSYNRRTMAIEKVNLPYIPDDADDFLLDATQGFLDHEVGHVLFTDQKVVLKAEKLKVHSLHNMIEDTFVERRMGEHFPGCGANLTKMHGFFLTEWIDTQLKEQPEHSAAILMVVAIRAWAGQPAFADYMGDKWELMKDVTDRLGKDFPAMIRNVKSSDDGLKVAVEAKKRLEPKKPPVPAAPPSAPTPPAPPSTPSDEPSPPSDEEPNSSAPSNEPPSAPEDDEPPLTPGGMPNLDGSEPPQGEEVQEPEAQPEPTPEPEAPAEEQDEGDAEPTPEPAADADDEEELDDEDDSAPAPEMSGGASDDSDDEDDSDDQPGDGMAGGDTGGETEGDTGDTAADGDDEQGGAGEADAPESGKGSAPGGGNPSEGNDEPRDPNDERDFNQELEDAGMTDFDDAAAAALTKNAVAATKESDYSVFTRDEDAIYTMEAPEGFDQNRVTAMQKEVDHMIGPLQKDLQRAISARSASVWTGGHKRGKLHGASLARVLTGREDVFRQKQVNKTKDVAVSLLVDASGSMWAQRKIRVAAYTAYALSAVLDNLGIPNEVLAFSTKDFTGDTYRAMYDEMREHRFNYSRSRALNIAIVKAFSERLTPDTRRRFALLAGEDNGLLDENVDGESVQIAHRRLSQQRAARKVLMVLSDGKPACEGLSQTLNNHLIEVVKQIEARGTDVVALGIIDDSVKQFYKRAIVMQNVADLPTLVMHELHKLLVV
jgi:cobalamin biosynthesis protein CobT